jgi:hypothetical protein
VSDCDPRPAEVEALLLEIGRRRVRFLAAQLGFATVHVGRRRALRLLDAGDAHRKADGAGGRS